MQIPQSFGSGRKTVTSSGTAVPLSDVPNIVTSLQITALPTNSNLVWVGGSNVKAQVGQQVGQPLNANDSFYVAVADINRVYLDAITDGEGVTFTYTDTFRP